MAFTFGFYNSLRGDRKYDAQQLSEIFDGILADGIIPNIGQLFAVSTANNGMQINVGTGRAWFNHTWTKNDSVMVLTVPQSDITRARFDAVVLEINHTEQVRANAIKIVQGVPEVNPVKPTLVNTDKIKQYPLAYINVPAAAETIKAENIENMVGREPTVFASGILRPVPIDDLWNQWEGEWDTWFASIKLQLSGDIVSNLQYQIDQLRERITDVEFNLEKTELLSRNLAKITINIKDKNQIPVKNICIDGVVESMTSSALAYSDLNGVISGYISAGSKTISISNFLDVTSTSETKSFVSGERYTIDLIAAYRVFCSCTTKKWYVSKEYPNAKISLCGGGGGGSSAGKQIRDNSGNYWSYLGGGGGGGYVNKSELSLVPKTAYSVSRGSGGSGGAKSSDTANPGSNGGTSSFESITASGGSGGGTSYGEAGRSGGYGNGNGGYGGRLIVYNNTGNVQAGSGSAGTGSVYTSETGEASVGGGGGGGGAYPRSNVSNSDYYNGSSGRGGAPSGATGGNSASSLGGGGGGACEYDSYDGGRGGNGYVSVRLV